MNEELETRMVEALEKLASKTGDLGFGSGDGEKGCLEFIGMQLRDQGSAITTSLDGIADSIYHLATAVEDLSKGRA